MKKIVNFLIEMLFYFIVFTVLVYIASLFNLTTFSFDKTMKLLDIANYVYFGGHRPVKENYRLRQNGKFIQIHNPKLQNIVLVRPDRKFNPETDIVSVSKFK